MAPHPTTVAPALCATLALASGASAQWTMTNIHPANSTSSYAWSASENRIAGYAYLSNPARQSACVWTNQVASSWVELAPAPAVSTISFAFSVGGNGGGQQGGNYVPVGGGSMNRACYWTGSAASMVDLHPTTGGFLRSGVLANSQGQQWGYVQDASFYSHACVWTGSAASRIDLSPPGSLSSGFAAADANHQGGYATFAASGNLSHAGIWSGTAASWADLHPAGAYSSAINGLDGNQQVGIVNIGSGVNDGRAYLWTGTPGSAVNLHPTGAASSVAYAVHGGVQVGNITVGGLTRASVWRGTAASREDPLPNLPTGTTQTEARGVFTTPTTITVVGMISMPQGRWNAVMWTKPNTPPPCSPADIGSAGGQPGSDGHLDNNDFIVFITRFFDQTASADVGIAGGLPGHDGAFDNNDFIVFINQFFDGAAAGC